MSLADEGDAIYKGYDDPSDLDLTTIEGYSAYQDRKANWRSWCDRNWPAISAQLRGQPV
jgi:hypothetical protein